VEEGHQEDGQDGGGRDDDGHDVGDGGGQHGSALDDDGRGDDRGDGGGHKGLSLQCEAQACTSAVASSVRAHAGQARWADIAQAGGAGRAFTCHIRPGLVVLVMLVALRDGRQSARSAQDVVEGAILRRARPSQRARRSAAEGDVAASRAAGGASAGAGARAIRSSRRGCARFSFEMAAIYCVIETDGRVGRGCPHQPTLCTLVNKKVSINPRKLW
jgi:hypothetical protein